MRLYHFLSERDALDDLTRQRLKLSEIENLNDPFELWCSDQRDRRMRFALQNWKREMSKRYGLVCFSAAWQNPLLWSHYADRHRGICLGFDVPDNAATPVKYIDARTPLRLPLTDAAMRTILFTKFVGWSYEEEWRAWFRLEERDPNAKDLYFREFDAELSLREVIVGPLCVCSRSVIDAIERYGGSVRGIKAQLAFESFHVVEDNRGLIVQNSRKAR